MGKDNQTNIAQAKKTAVLIEQDMANEKFDQTLVRHKGETEIPVQERVIVKYFEEWVTIYKQNELWNQYQLLPSWNTLMKWDKSDCSD